MPGTILFLANSADPTDSLTVFGKGHITDFDVEDEAYVQTLLLEGKACILSTEDVAALTAERQRHREFLNPPHVWPGVSVTEARSATQT